MTELAPYNGHADLQPNSIPTLAPTSTRTTNGYSPQAEEAPDDDSVIRCFCDISEDDGNTVLCEVCNTWQHILCYYPHNNVPDEHVCVQCRPRSYDRKRALERQKQRGLISPAERKLKKAPSKSHKKKVQDNGTGANHTNGWLSGAEAAADRGSGSPREHGPPTKRPKTTHRTSASVSAPATGPSRKRAGSSTLNGQSPAKSPRSTSPEALSADYYSEEYMADDSASNTETNSYASLEVSRDLSRWLNETDALQEISPGLSQFDVFTRWTLPIKDLHQQSPGFTPCNRADVNLTIKGRHPVHRWIELTAPCGPSTFIGELNGLVGRTEEYQADPANRWDELQHPMPYVFFHDRLPGRLSTCRWTGK